MAVCSPMPDPWNGGGQEWLNDGTDHDWHNLRPLPQVATSSMLGGNSTAVADKPPSVHATVTQTSICQIIRDQAVDVSRSDDRGILDRPSDQPLQHSIPTLPPPASAGIDPLLFDNDFNAYGYLSPGIMDYFEFPTPLTPISIPPGVPDKPVGQPDILFSVDQVQRMRKLWRSQRSAPAARIGRSLWRHTVHHQADNIFARPVASSEKEPNPSTHNGACNSGWGMDETCRNLLIEFCRNLEDRFHDEALADLTPHPQGDDSTAEPGNSIPVSPADGFPTREVLDASLDTFFQCSYLPFVHKATFDARTVPASLLLPMILIGLSSVYPGRSKVFVLSHQKRLMRFCRSDMTAKALGSGPPWELLVSIASTLLVSYLSLGYLEDLDECQAHMLCAQMLRISEKHGIFTASDHDDLLSHLTVELSDGEDAWKTWGRVESIKRTIACLLWMDMAYTRLLRSAGVLDADKVELYLPCEDALFEAPTFTRFLHLARHGAQLVMQQVAFKHFHVDPPPTLSHFSLETFLVLWYLQITAIRHRLPIGHYVPLEARSHSPAEVISESSKGKDVVTSLLMLPSKYASLFRQRHRVTAFAWSNINIALTADLDLLEIASGREGLESARTAILAVSKWVQTPGARWAALHAAQIFEILSSSRLGESDIARPDLLLFNSALVLAMYLFVSNRQGDNDDFPAFELLQEVDWTALGGEGLRRPPQTIPPSPGDNTQYLHDATTAARYFIRHGGPVTFAGETQRGSGVLARKVLLNYVRLLDDLGKWRHSRYSQLLRTMSDFIIEGNTDSHMRDLSSY